MQLVNADHAGVELAPAGRRAGRRPARWRGFAPYLAALAACVLTGFLTYQAVLGAQLRGEEAIASRRLEFSTLSLEAMLARNEALPGLLALERKLSAAIDDDPGARQEANKYLEAVAQQAGISAAYLMNSDGLTIAASNWAQRMTFLGQNYGFRPYVMDALAGEVGRFHGVGATSGEAGYFLATKVQSARGNVGVIAVKVSLEPFEKALKQGGEWVAVIDREGVVILSAIPGWHYRVLEPLPDAVRARLAAARQYGNHPLEPIRPGLAITSDTREISLKLAGATADYSIVRRPVGPLGWQMLMLKDQDGSRWAAGVAGIAATAIAACVLGLLLHLRLKREQREQARLAEAALRRASEDLDRRISQRTSELTTANLSLAAKVEELKKTEAILRETRDAAVQAGKLTVLGQMSAGMTHELNQPLGALNTLSDNTVHLIDQDRLPEAKENLHLISELVGRMGRIVKQLKIFARKEPPVLTRVQLSEAIDHALMLVEPHRRETGAQVRVRELPDGLCVQADSLRLEQVLVNVLRNALDAVAASSSRQVTIDAQRTGNLVALTICDTGPGFDEAVLARLFEPFFTTKPAGHGLGLGLALSLAIVEGFGGKLQAGNGPEGGAQFRLLLEPA